MRSENKCKYCGGKTTNTEICATCYAKLKLVKKLREICEAIKQGTKRTD